MMETFPQSIRKAKRLFCGMGAKRSTIICIVVIVSAIRRIKRVLIIRFMTGIIIGFLIIRIVIELIIVLFGLIVGCLLVLFIGLLPGLVIALGILRIILRHERLYVDFLGIVELLSRLVVPGMLIAMSFIYFIRFCVIF